MWIDNGSRLINLNKICLIYPAEEAFEWEGTEKIHYHIHYFPTYKNFEDWLNEESETAEYEIFFTSKERDARYEEIKKLLIKNKTIEVY